MLDEKSSLDQVREFDIRLLSVVYRRISKVPYLLPKIEYLPFFACLIVCTLLLSCAKEPGVPPPKAVPPGLKSQKPYQIKGVWYYPLASGDGYVEEGVASWYGSDFHGKPTACGEPYDMWAMTAAHKTLPLGTYVKVTNPRNDRSTILRINDRGPFVSGRIIDLSCRAAQELGYYGKGTASVRVEAVQVAAEYKLGQETYWKVDPVPSFRYGLFTVQIGAFRDQKNASRLRDRMSNRDREARIVQVTDRQGDLYRVHLGKYQDIILARQDSELMKSMGFPDAFVLAVEGKQAK